MDLSTYEGQNLISNISLEVRELDPAEDRHHAVPGHPDDIAVLLRLYDRVPDLPVRQVFVVESRGAEPLAVEGELRDVGQVDVVEEEYLRHLEVLLVEPLQGLGLDPPLHDLAQAHEEGLAHLVGDVVRPALLVEDAEEEALPKEVEGEGCLEGPDDRDGLSVLVHLDHGVEGEGPLEGLRGDVQVRDLGEEAEAVALDPYLLLELEVLQLRGDERQVALLADDEDLSCKNQDAGR